MHNNCDVINLAGCREIEMAETTFAWLSVTVKSGVKTLVPRKIVKIGAFGQFLESLGFVNQSVKKKISIKE